jgi:DNA-binding protein YbaB
MSAPLHNRFESALAELRGQQEKIRDFGAAMAARTTVVTSKNRMVAATVDSSGRLVGLAFKGNRYRSLPPAELSALVVETVVKAQQAASKEALAAAAGLIPAGFGFPGLTGGEVDLDGMFDAAVRLAEQPVLADEAAGGDAGEQVRDV